MPKARDPARDRAREMWEKSGKALKLREIAESLGVPEGTVRVWKHKDNWEENVTKNERNVTNDLRNVTNPRQRGAQPGHPPQGGAKPGNLNAVITGEYTALHDDLLTDEERAIYHGIVAHGAERRESLVNHLAILRIRERRLLKDISSIREGSDMLTRHTVSQVEPTGKKAADGREVTKVVKISHEQETRLAMLLRFEDSLTRVQAEIRRTEDSIRQMDAESSKQERLSRGEVTERIEGNTAISGKVVVTADPYEELTTEELRKLARLVDEQTL